MGEGLSPKLASLALAEITRDPALQTKIAKLDGSWLPIRVEFRGANVGQLGKNDNSELFRNVYRDRGGNPQFDLIFFFWFPQIKNVGMWTGLF